MGPGRFRGPADTAVADRATVFLEWKTLYLGMLLLKRFQIQMAGNAPVDALAVPRYNLPDPVSGVLKVAQALL